MLVLKFGGSVLVDAAAFGRAAEVCADRLRSGEGVVAVVSAMFGVTNALDRGDVATQSRAHAAILESIAGEPVSPPWNPAPEDPVEAMALGEQMATALMARACARRGLPVEIRDPGELGILTDENPREARPRPGFIERIARSLDGARSLVLVPGFFGRDEQGRVRLLGRNASDLSAAMIAAAVGARSLEVIAAVPGLMTADPALVPEARLIAEVTHDEVLEMARGGAPVLHADAIRIARDHDLDIVLRGLESGPQSLVRPSRREAREPFRALVHRAAMTLLHLEPAFGATMGQLSSRLFAALDQVGLVPTAMVSSTASLSLTLRSGAALDAVLEEVAEVGRLNKREEVASLELVGHGRHDLAQARARALQVLQARDIPILMLAEPAGRQALVFVVASAQLREAAVLLHQAFFDPRS